MRKNKNLAKILLVLALSLILAAMPVCASAVAAYINTNAKVYGAGGKSGTLSRGAYVNFVGVSGNWAKIYYRGVPGITQLKNITLRNGMIGYAKVNAPLYKGTADGSTYGTIPKGTMLKVVGINGSFYQVTNTAGSLSGYVRAAYVSKTKPYVAPATKPSTGTTKPSTGTVVKPTTKPVVNPTTKPVVNPTTPPSTGGNSTATTRAEKVAALAIQQVGKKYAYGAEGPSTFDCSGLTYYIYKAAAGVTLKRNSYDQGMDGRFTTITSISSLKAGDLLCFNTSGGTDVDHVAVYVGNNLFVNASETAGVVKYGSLGDDYYKSAFKWGKRIV